MSRALRRYVLTLAAACLAVMLASSPAYAQPVPPELMAKLANYAQSFEAQRKRASYRVDGHMVVLDGDEQPTETKDLSALVVATGDAPTFKVLRYVDDGVDKTADAEKQAKESAAKRKKKHDSGKEVKMPISASQQDRYVFDETETNPDGSRVLVQFTPKEGAEDTVEGSAWVDVASGTVVSATFKMSKTSLFVRYVHFAIEFGETTSLGPAVSKVTVDGEGGILFFRRHFHATATLSGYSVAP